MAAVLPSRDETWELHCRWNETERLHEARGCPPDLVRAVAAHHDHMQIPRETAGVNLDEHLAFVVRAIKEARGRIFEQAWEARKVRA